MISAFEQEPITVREQRADLPPAQAEPAWPLHPVNGARRNHVAVSGPQVIVTRERDHRDMVRLAGGDDHAMDSLMQRHARKLSAHLERIVKNRADAAELVQEAFVRVFRHRRDFNFEGRFSTWLYVIGSRLAINLLRWRSRRPEFVPLPEAVQEQSGSSTCALVDPAPTPREQAERDEWTDALELALARMPPQLREPLLMVSLDGFSQAEVARRLDCTVKAVETRVYHGRKRLRAELESLLNPWRCRVNGAIDFRCPR